MNTQNNKQQRIPIQEATIYNETPPRPSAYIVILNNPEMTAKAFVEKVLDYIPPVLSDSPKPFVYELSIETCLVITFQSHELTLALLHKIHGANCDFITYPLGGFIEDVQPKPLRTSQVIDRPN